MKYIIAIALLLTLPIVWAENSPETLDDLVIEDPNQPSPQEMPGAIDPNAAVAAGQENPQVTLLEGFFEDINYSPQDKRDPFLPYLTLNKVKVVNAAPDTPLEPLQNYTLDKLKLVGIIWDVGNPKALVLDPDGKSHIVIQNAKMGKDFGYVAAIREGELIVVEQYQDGLGNKSFQTKILKLTQN